VERVSGAASRGQQIALILQAAVAKCDGSSMHAIPAAAGSRRSSPTSACRREVGMSSQQSVDVSFQPTKNIHFGRISLHPNPGFAAALISQGVRFQSIFSPIFELAPV